MNKPIKTNGAGGFVINPKGQVLMVEEYGQYWVLPRGHIKNNEGELDAAIREIQEESGITNLQLQTKLGSYTRSTFGSSGQADNRELKHITIFYFKTNQSKLEPQDPNITDASWYSFTDASKILINKADIDFFNSCLKKIKLCPKT